ncbi:MAG: hypothetical protein AAFO07_07320 [Bacteroidota bacterium]
MTNVNKNEDFVKVVSHVRKGLPVSYSIGIVLNYLINAAFVAMFLYPILSKINSDFALGISISGAFAVQFFRALIVLTDQLHFSQESTKRMVAIIAFAMTIFSGYEAWHLVASYEILNDSEFTSIFVFILGVIIGGFILEINFIKKISELTIDSQEEKPKADTTPLPKLKVEKQLAEELMHDPAKLNLQESDEVDFQLNLSTT